MGVTLHNTFIPEQNIALFLDVDGTLLEIAPRPTDVNVPAALCDALHETLERMNGALALVSGRTINELDRLFSPWIFPAAGQHGLERRDARGHVTKPHVDASLLNEARRALHEFQLTHEGVLLEDKTVALALHYRLAPHCESAAYDIMSKLVQPIADQFVLRSGKCVLEIAPRGYSKKIAIESFMTEAPFAGKAPVFVGDDITDEDGFIAVNALGGYSVRVGSLVKSAARYQFNDVSAVIAWLCERNRKTQA